MRLANTYSNNKPNEQKQKKALAKSKEADDYKMYEREVMARTSTGIKLYTYGEKEKYKNQFNELEIKATKP